MFKFPLSLKVVTTLFALSLLVLYILSNFLDELRVYQGSMVLIYALAISSVIIITGYSGQISMGQGALVAVGAYSMVLSQSHLHLPIWACLLVAVVVSGIFGGLLGLAAARLSGPYLAGSTLALAVGLPSVANQFKLLGGEQGLIYETAFPPLSLGSDFSQFKWYFWIISVVAIVAFWLIRNILNSRYGRTWLAVRGSAVSAELAGINVAKSRILAFTISSGVAGLAGGLLAMLSGSVSPSAFPLAFSFSILTGAVLSGVTTLGGVMIGAVTLVAIPELADEVSSLFSVSENVAANLPNLLVSGLLILTVLFLPNGPIEQYKMRSASKRFKLK